MKHLLPLLTIFLLTAPVVAQRNRSLDTRDDYEAMIQFNINESAAKERRDMAIQIAKLESEIQSQKEKLDLLQKLLVGSVPGAGVVAGGYKLISRLRGKSDGESFE